MYEESLAALMAAEKGNGVVRIPANINDKDCLIVRIEG